MRDVDVMYWSGDELLKAPDGGGERFEVLRPSDYLDVFVYDGIASDMKFPPLRRASLTSFREGHSFVLTMEWSEDGDERGRMLLAWTSGDHRAGRAPWIAFGEEAESLATYTRNREASVTAALLRKHRRVSLMTTRDIRRRGRQERQEESAIVTPDEPIRTMSIAIQGFRGFREEVTLRLAQPTGAAGSGMTIVVGANNTGKSTIWESFDAVSRKSDVSFSAGRRNVRTPGGVRITLRRSDGSTCTLASQNENTSETRKEWLPEPPGAESFEIVSVPSRRTFEVNFGRSWGADRDWMAQGSDLSRHRQANQMSPFTSRLFKLNGDAEEKEAFDKLMAEVVGYPIDWTIDLGEGQQGQSYFLKVSTGDIDHTSEGLGDGIISLIFILDAIRDLAPNSLVVLDEPELSLHPQLVRRLGRVLAERAKDRQIVVFTHSPLLVSWDDIAAGAEIARVYKQGADSKIAQVRRETIEEVTKARGNWRVPHTLGQEANEALFLDDRIIVVEGPEDRGLLPTVAIEAGVELPGTIFGWGAGGAQNVPRIIALLKDLGFTKIAAVLDDNVPDVVQQIHEVYPRVLVKEMPAADIRDKHEKSKDVTGLLDERGKRLKEDLKEPTRQVLQSVADYLRGSESPVVLGADAPEPQGSQGTV